LVDGSQQPRGVMPARPPIGRDRGGIQALDRAFLILDIIADAGGEAKLTEIASTAGLHVSTCHHLISTLCNWGYVARGTLNRSYVLGPRILHLSAACLRQVDLPRRAQAYIDRLNDQTHEAVQLAIMQDTSLVNILRREARHALRVDAGLAGRMNAAHATATGKAILAWLPPTELERIVSDKGMTAFTPSTIIDLHGLKEELRLTRRNGYAIDREEFQPGVICIGAAIRDHAGGVVGSISVSSPVFRATAEHLEQIRIHLLAATDELSMELGAPGAILERPTKNAAAE
jgi:IclR family transcriptional regulator, acetate operon repressor